MPETTRPGRTRDRKVSLWMRSELLQDINRIAETEGMTRDGIFERGMHLFVTRRLRDGRK